MTDKTRDVVALGNALMDIIAPIGDAELAQLGIEKNAMTLIDPERAITLTEITGDASQTPGGSACNTLAGLASAGANTGFMGKLAADPVGDTYAEALATSKVFYKTPRLLNTLPSGRSIIFVSPDGARSMNTLLGAATEFNETDIDQELIGSAKYLYLEGYLFDKPAAKSAFLSAAKSARRQGTDTALSLSDPFCVERHRNDFLKFITDQCEVVFGNADEVKALFQTDDLDKASKWLAGICEIACITQGADGAVIFHNGEKVVHQSAYLVDVVDTTGAGDQFAAGVLYGLCNNTHLAFCAEYGACAAAEVISHYGARPETPLSELFTKIMH